MVLAWSGLQIDAHELAPQVYTPSLKGSLQPAMIAAARRHGRVAYPISGASALLEEITAGHPVIVLQNLGLSWIPAWHYAVVIGYDLDKAMIILHSGITKRKTTALNTFGNTNLLASHAATNNKSAFSSDTNNNPNENLLTLARMDKTMIAKMSSTNKNPIIIRKKGNNSLLLLLNINLPEANPTKNETAPLNTLFCNVIEIINPIINKRKVNNSAQLSMKSFPISFSAFLPNIFTKLLTHN